MTKQDILNRINKQNKPVVISDEAMLNYTSSIADTLKLESLCKLLCIECELPEPNFSIVSNDKEYGRIASRLNKLASIVSYPLAFGIKSKEQLEINQAICNDILADKLNLSENILFELNMLLTRLKDAKGHHSFIDEEFTPKECKYPDTEVYAILVTLIGNILNIPNCVSYLTLDKWVSKRCTKLRN